MLGVFRCLSLAEREGGGGGKVVVVNYAVHGGLLCHKGRF